MSPGLFILQDVPCAVDDSEHIDPIWPDMVDDAIRSGEHLADLVETVLGDTPTGHWKGRDLLRSAGDAVNRTQRVGLRVLRDVRIDRV